MFERYIHFASHACGNSETYSNSVNVAVRESCYIDLINNYTEGSVRLTDAPTV